MVDIANLTPGNIIRIVMVLLLVSGLVTLYVNTANLGKEKSINDRYYHSNIAASVLLTLYIMYTVLLENEFIPN